MDPVNVRNLEQIQEKDGDGRSSRLAALLLAGIGGGALAVAIGFTMRQSSPPAESKVDPLAALVKSHRAEVSPPEAVHPSEVTFPSVLSDNEHPTTALAAVKDERGRLVAPESLTAPANTAAPPPPAETLPVVPLPAGTLMNATSVTAEPKDSLTALAAEVSKVPESAPVGAGSPGGYQLQIASFKDQGDADRLVGELIKRGHRAYRQGAYVADRGLWQRVRIGPFDTKLAAQKYKNEFDRKERTSAFLIDPDRVKRQEELRAAKLAQRDER